MPDDPVVREEISIPLLAIAAVFTGLPRAAVCAAPAVIAIVSSRG